MANQMGTSINQLYFQQFTPWGMSRLYKKRNEISIQYVIQQDSIVNEMS